ncbi:MAG: LAGLIDADG family homing endonuclease [Candidatus Woesearchaeota archaeon]
MDDSAGKIRDLEQRLAKYKKTLEDDVIAFGPARKVIPAREMEANLKCLKLAAELREQGLTFKKISEKVGYDKTSIAEWLLRGQLPGNLSKLYDMLDVPRDFSPELAYLLGAHAALNMAESKYRYFLFTTGKPGVLKKLKQATEKIWPGRWCKNKAYEGIYHPDIVRHFHLITSHNTQVPWEHLGTVSEKKSYLQGIFDSKGIADIGKKCFFLTKPSRSFLEEILVLLAEFNVLGTICKTTNTYCAIFYSNDVARLLKLGVLPKEKRDAFKNLKANPAEDSVQDYYSFLIFKDAYATDFFSKKFGVAAGTIREWKKGIHPKPVSKYLAIEKIRKRYDRNSVAFLYRNCGLDSKTARDFARDFSINDLNETYPDGVVAVMGNASKIIEDVIAYKRREAREFRCVMDSFNPGKNASLYDKICAFSKIYCNNPRMCRCYADDLSTEYNIPVKFIYEFLVGEKPLNLE